MIPSVFSIAYCMPYYHLEVNMIPTVFSLNRPLWILCTNGLIYLVLCNGNTCAFVLLKSSAYIHDVHECNGTKANRTYRIS